MNDDSLLARNKLDIGIQTHVKLKRGWVLTEIKNNRMYEGNADTFEEYLAQEDVRKDAKECMDLYKFYVEKHKVHAEDIQDIHHLRLVEAKKAIKLQPDKLWEWIDNCRILSWKDLINAVREVRGKPSMPRTVAITSLNPSLPPDSLCCICGATPVENAHWPITKKMGGKFTIPLCRQCHDEYHRIGDITFYDHYKRKIGEHLADSRSGK